MKRYTLRDYTNRVYDKIKDDVPGLTKAHVAKVIGIYATNLKVLFYTRKTIIINSWMTMAPFNKKLFKKIQKERRIDD